MRKEQDFINKINELILEKYEVKLQGFGDQDPGVVAYYSPVDNAIFINRKNKYIFNDYYTFIVVMLHENIHKINTQKGLEDTYMDGDKQIHNDIFKNAMIDMYGLFCNKNYNGEVDLKDKRNDDTFNEIMRNKIVDAKVFDELQQEYFSKYYEETPVDESGGFDGSGGDVGSGGFDESDEYGEDETTGEFGTGLYDDGDYILDDGEGEWI